MAYKSEFTGEQIDNILKNSVSIDGDQTITDVKTFSVPPLMTETIDAGDSSTKIPNTAWVQNEISNSLGDLDAILQDLDTGTGV